jgi:hypothetical protein
MAIARENRKILATLLPPDLQIGNKQRVHREQLSVCGIPVPGGAAASAIAPCCLLAAGKRRFTLGWLTGQRARICLRAHTLLAII